MPPKRAASKTRATKVIPALTEEAEKSVDKVQKKGRAAKVPTKTSPTEPEIKPKQRGRPKKEKDADHSEAQKVEQAPVKNIRAKKGRPVAAEPVAEPVKKGRGRPVQSSVIQEEPKKGKSRARSVSKTRIETLKSPARKTDTAKTPPNKESPTAKTPNKRGPRRKSPINKQSRGKSPATKSPRRKSPMARETKAKSPVAKISGPQSPAMKSVKAATAKLAVESKPKPRGRPKKEKDAVVIVDAPEVLQQSQAGAKNAMLVVEPNEGMQDAEVEAKTIGKEECNEDRTAETSCEEPEVECKPKSRGRPARKTVVVAESKIAKPRGRKAKVKDAEPPHVISGDPLNNAANDSIPSTVNTVALEESPKMVDEIKVSTEKMDVRENTSDADDQQMEGNETKKPEMIEQAAPQAVAMELVENSEGSNKRKLSEEGPEEEVQLKKARTQKLPVVKLPKNSGSLMTCGTDSTGELGLKTVGLEKRRPVLVPGVIESVSLIAAGAMHTVAVTAGGCKIYTFGCNDELALGRKTAPANGDAPSTDPDATVLINEDVPEAVPTSFQLANKIVKVTAGDSHTAALTEFGCLYAWGCFRDNRGRVGLIPDGKPKNPIGNPVAVMPFETTVVDIASGDNHVIALTENGTLYSFGVGEQGQLGRIPELECKINEDYSNIELFLKPQVVVIDGNPEIKCDRVWAAGFTSFVRTTDGAIYSWGLNNYSQLGFKSDAEKTIEASPRPLPRFCSSVESVTGGLHHSLALDSEGKVYSWGKYLYGRLGHPDLTADVEAPRLIETLKDVKVTQIACGNDCSFAVTESGHLYSWGMYAVHLGHVQKDELVDEDDKDVKLPRKVTGKKLADTNFIAVASGSQHAVFIASSEQRNGN